MAPLEVLLQTALWLEFISGTDEGTVCTEQGAQTEKGESVEFNLVIKRVLHEFFYAALYGSN